MVTTLLQYMKFRAGSAVRPIDEHLSLPLLCCDASLLAKALQWLKPAR